MKHTLKTLSLSLILTSMITGIMGVAFQTLPIKAAELTLPSAQTQPDPLVLVFKDITSTSSCHQTLKKKVNEKWKLLSIRDCELGTILSPQNITQSEAIAHHQLYILLPSKTPSLEQRNSFQKQVIDLTKTIRTNLRSALTAKQDAVLQYSTCSTGWYGNGTNWNNNGDTIYSEVTYQVTSCSNLSLSDSYTAMVSYSGGLGAMASGLQYSYGYWDFCDGYDPLLNYNGDWYDHQLGGNTTFNQNYWAVAWVADPPWNGNCQAPGGAGVNSVDLGPLV